MGKKFELESYHVAAARFFIIIYSWIVYQAGAENGIEAQANECTAALAGLNAQWENQVNESLHNLGETLTTICEQKLDQLTKDCVNLGK